MSKCIQLGCNCTGYKEPAQSKSTLLQFRLSCQECGHQASEHRKLTPVDQCIKAQVAAAKKSRCTALIPPSEIPLSPVFSTYDLIPIPRDDCIPNTDNSVQCTCQGFQLSDVIRLCQKFRTHSLNDVPSELNAISCSFCAHPMSQHAVVKQDSSKEYSNALFANMRQSLGPYDNLALKHSTSLLCLPANSSCLEVITPSRSDRDCFLLLSLGRFQSSDNLRLVTVRHTVDIKDTDRTNIADSSSAPTEDLETVSTAVSRKRVRKNSKKGPASPPPKRSSARLATKKAREEEKKILMSLKGLKGVGKFAELDLTETRSEGSDLSELEQREVTESTVSFVKQLGVSENYQSFALPQEVSSASSVLPLMAAHRVPEKEQCSDPPSPPSDTLLVAVGTKDSADLFLTLLQLSLDQDSHSRDQCSSSEDQNTSQRADQCSSSEDQSPSQIADQSLGQCEWECVKSAEQGKLECFVLKEGSVPGDMMLLIGYSSGLVCARKVVVTCDRIEDIVPVVSFQCSCQCLAVNCSMDSMFLCAGTMLGEVVFSVLPTPEDIATDHTQPAALQTISCCEAPVRCITWSSDGRMVAVGACDDTIRVLQCRELAVKEGPASKGSILNYFKRSRWQPKFTHTYTLKAHTSFIADLHFAQGYLLSSLGWDGQLLFWSQLIQRPFTHHQPHRSRGRSVERTELEVELLDPAGGYKIGPSLAVEFLPVLLRPVVGCGLLVAMANKLGGVTIGSYFKQ